MKTDIWPDDTSMPQMSDWLAELRDDDDAAGRPADRPAEPVGTHGPRPEPSTAAAPSWPDSQIEVFAAKARAHAQARARAQARADAQASARARAMARTDAGGRAQISGRAVIGDELRMPIAWCEFGSCISWHSDPAALGEADIRARAIAAGWRVDALGRLACPRCQQSDGQFWATHPVRPRARDTAAVTSPAAAWSDEAAGARGGTEAGMVPAPDPALLPLPVQDRQRQAVRHLAALPD